MNLTEILDWIIVVAAAVCSLVAVLKAIGAEENAQRALNKAYETEKEAEEYYNKVRDDLEVMREEIGHKIAADRIAMEQLKAELAAVQKLIPEDVKEERMRRDVLMKQLNDELETRVQAERDWNHLVSTVINYSGVGSGEK